MNQKLLDEKSRVDELLKQGRITNDEYQTLVSALDSQSTQQRTFWVYVINPFQKLNTIQVISFALPSILLMSFLGQKIGLHFRGPLDFKIIESGKTNFTLLQLFVQNLVDVSSIVFFFYIGSLLNKRKNLRAIDFIASIGFTRLPYALFALSLVVLEPLFPNILPKTPGPYETPEMMALILFAIGFLAWEITLLFSALKESSGLKANSLWVTFIVGIVLAEVSSYSINTLILK